MYENLVRISTYAKMLDLSKEMIRVRILKGLVKTVTIDKTIFIKLTDEELKNKSHEVI